MAYRMLELNLISANDLKRVTLFSRMRVYAIATICGGDPRMSTHCTMADCYGGCNPTWNSAFHFPIPIAADNHGLALHVTLRTRRIFGDRDVGEVFVPFDDLVASGDKAMELRTAMYQVRRRYSGHAHGVLYFRYKFIEPPATGAAANKEGQYVKYVKDSEQKTNKVNAGSARVYPQPQQDATPYQSPQQNATAYPPPQQDATVYPPPQKAASTVYPPPQEDAAVYSPPQQDAAEYPPPQQDAKVYQRPKKDVYKPPKQDAKVYKPPKQDVYQHPQQDATAYQPASNGSSYPEYTPQSYQYVSPQPYGYNAAPQQATYVYAAALPPERHHHCGHGHMGMGLGLVSPRRCGRRDDDRGDDW